MTSFKFQESVGNAEGESGVIPVEELRLLLRTFGKALRLCWRGPGSEAENRRAGRELLQQGELDAVRWVGEPWGPELLGLWDLTLQHYDERYPDEPDSG